MDPTGRILASNAFARQVSENHTHDWSDMVRGPKGQLPVFFLNGTQDPEIKLESLREFQEDDPWIAFTEYEDADQLLFFLHCRGVLRGYSRSCKRQDFSD